MTDTRTDPRTDNPTAPTTDDPAASMAPEGRQTMTDDRSGAPENRSNEQLSTSDIAGGNDDATATGTTRSTTDSAIPDAKVAPLFSEDDAASLRERWTDVQAGFVDEPRNSVEQADSLVAEVMKRLADSFATERQSLERQWSSGEQASTEDLRVALRRYRSFFDRLLSV